MVNTISITKTLLIITITLCIAVTNCQQEEVTLQRYKRWSSLIPRPAEIHECKNDADCSNIPFTSCAIDQLDKKFKCLCADSSLPNNGDCKKRPKELRTHCAEDYECQPGAECAPESEDVRSKLCFCRDDYLEVNNTCTNGCNLMQSGSMAIIFGATYSIFRFY